MQGSDLRYCRLCGYILEGLPEHRCPECGRPFDPTDPHTYARRLQSGLGLLITALVADGLIVAALCVLMLVGPVVDSSDGLFTTVALVVCILFSTGLTLAGATVFKTALRVWNPPPTLTKRWPVMAALGIAALPYLLLAGLIANAFL